MDLDSQTHPHITRSVKSFSQKSNKHILIQFDVVMNNLSKLFESKRPLISLRQKSFWPDVCREIEYFPQIENYVCVSSPCFPSISEEQKRIDGGYIWKVD